jgi:hypothetical protein
MWSNIHGTCRKNDSYIQYEKTNDMTIVRVSDTSYVCVFQSTVRAITCLPKLSSKQPRHFAFFMSRYVDTARYSSVNSLRHAERIAAGFSSRGSFSQENMRIAYTKFAVMHVLARWHSSPSEYAHSGVVGVRLKYLIVPLWRDHISQGRGAQGLRRQKARAEGCVPSPQ